MKINVRTNFYLYLDGTGTDVGREVQAEGVFSVPDVKENRQLRIPGTGSAVFALTVKEVNYDLITSGRFVSQITCSRFGVAVKIDDDIDQALSRLNQTLRRAGFHTITPVAPRQ